MRDGIHVDLDFTPCQNLSQVFGEMRKKMGWQDWYGSNLDALWDILTGLPHRGDDFTILRPHSYGEGEEAVRLTKKVDLICSIFQEAQAQGDLTVQIEYLD